ncbi:MAG: hypothetical protein ABIJ56_07890 [Pseudomonadota bacterium]
MPDLSPCPGGICCSARCRMGGDCCSNAQCIEGCKGIARPCRDVPGDSCNGQIGCFGTGENYCVEGTGPFCYDLEVGSSTCYDCGCTWSLVSCSGSGRVNCTRLVQRPASKGPLTTAAAPAGRLAAYVLAPSSM